MAHRGATRKGERHSAPNSPSHITDAATEFLASILPGGPPPRIQTIDRLLALGPRYLESLGHESQKILISAISAAQTRYGSAEIAAELIEAEECLTDGRSGTAISPEILAQYTARAAEAYAAAGQARKGVEMALKAVGYGRATDEKPFMFQALGVLAGKLALNGDFRDARSVIDEALDLAAESGWETTGSSPMLLAGRILLASADLETM